MPIRRWAMSLMLVVFNVADVLITRMIIARGGSEANPLMRGIISDLSSALFLKTLVAVSVAVLLLTCPRNAKIPDLAVGFVVVLYVVVMGWNLGILIQANQV